MATDQDAAPVDVAGAGLKIWIVASRYHDDVTSRLVEGATQEIARLGAELVEAVTIAGAYELPVLCNAIAPRPDCDAIVAIGCVIKGQTQHHDYIARAATSGIVDVSLRHSVPVAMGILTADNPGQAQARAGGAHGNKGIEAAGAAVEAAYTIKRLAGHIGS